MPDTTFLFAYGTLLHGNGHPEVEKAMKFGASPLGRAFAKGSLVRVGDYPGMVPGGVDGERVLGVVYRIIKQEIWEILDKYEECYPNLPKGKSEFFREQVQLVEGPVLQGAVSAYWYAKPHFGLEAIISGDWLAFRKEQELSDTVRRWNPLGIDSPLKVFKDDKD